MQLGTSGAFEIVFGILGVIASLAAAAAIFRSTFIKAQLEALRGDRDDQKARIDRQDAEIERLTRENADLATKCDTLERLVTGHDRLMRIEDKVDRLLEKVGA